MNIAASIKIAGDKYNNNLNVDSYTNVEFSQNDSIFCLSCFAKHILYLRREYILRNTGINNMDAIKII